MPDKRIAMLLNLEKNMEILKTQFKGIHNWKVPTLIDKVKFYKGKNVKKGG